MSSIFRSVIILSYVKYLAVIVMSSICWAPTTKDQGPNTVRFIVGSLGFYRSISGRLLTLLA